MNGQQKYPTPEKIKKAYMQIIDRLKHPSLWKDAQEQAIQNAQVIGELCIELLNQLPHVEKSVNYSDVREKFKTLYEGFEQVINLGGYRCRHKVSDAVKQCMRVSVDHILQSLQAGWNPSEFYKETRNYKEWEYVRQLIENTDFSQLGKSSNDGCLDAFNS